jgi:hypothetical protein
LNWKIYYDNGNTYSDGDGSVEDAPGLGVLGISIADSIVGRHLVSRRDYYWYDLGRWFGGDVFGLWDYLQRPGFKKVIFGRSTTNEDWNTALKRMLEDPDLPPKSAWSDDEIRP